MKKLFAILILAALILCACKPADDPTDVSQNTGTDSSVSDETSGAPGTPVDDLGIFAFTFRDVRLVLGEYADVESLLGEAVEKLEAPSCVHEGNDTVYSYDIVEIVTSPSDSGEYISSITLISDSVQTEEGIALGGLISSAQAAYGEGEESFGRYTFRRGASTLTMLTDDDGIILSIAYAYTGE